VEQMEQTHPQSITDLQPKMHLEGTVKETHIYGALVDIGLEQNGMVHISQLAPTRTNRVVDVVQPGDSVSVWVTKVDTDKGHIGLTMVKPPDVEWRELANGQVYTGTVTRMEAYGVFVDIGAERPGLLHIREMSDGYVRHPSELVKIGDEIEVRILKLDRQKRRIDLATPDLNVALEEIMEENNQEPAQTAMEIALQRAQSHSQDHKRHHKKHQSFDLSEREKILVSTLEKHSQH